MSKPIKLLFQYLKTNKTDFMLNSKQVYTKLHKLKTLKQFLSLDCCGYSFVIIICKVNEVSSKRFKALTFTLVYLYSDKFMVVNPEIVTAILTLLQHGRNERYVS